MSRKTLDLSMCAIAGMFLLWLFWPQAEWIGTPHPRSAEGPGGYLDTKFNSELNLSQTGVWDKQIPLPMRQKRAAELGYEVPER